MATSDCSLGAVTAALVGPEWGYLDEDDSTMGQGRFQSEDGLGSHGSHRHSRSQVRSFLRTVFVSR